MNNKNLLLSIASLALFSLSSLTLSMEKVDTSETKRDILETPSDVQVLKLLLDNGNEISEYDLEFSKKYNPKVHELYLKTLKDRHEKKKSKKKEVINSNDKLENNQ